MPLRVCDFDVFGLAGAPLQVGAWFDRVGAMFVDFFDGCARTTVAAWLAFYVLAQSDPQARRLLGIYGRRLNSNLVDALVQIAPRAAALRIAEGIAALIDGLYIRRALKHGPPDPASAIALVENYVDTELAALEGRQ